MDDSRQPLGFACRYCGSHETWVEMRFEPSRMGTYSLAGAQPKLEASRHPYAVCDGCGHVSRGEPVNS